MTTFFNKLVRGDRVTRCEKSFPFSTVLIENVYEKHLEKFKNFGFLDRYIYKIVKSKEQRLNVFFHQFLLLKIIKINICEIVQARS